jgi:4-hydroxybenzoate polyprenyltransferase
MARLITNSSEIMPVETLSEPLPPLVVDLDGTLVASDLLLESLLILAKNSLRHLLGVIWSLLHGRAHFKQCLVREAMPDPHTLPYNRELIGFLRAEKAKGRRLILATGADAVAAHAIARELGLFDEVMASDGATSLSGANKRDRLVAAFGMRGFDYVGNSWADSPVFKAAHAAFLVRPPAGLAHAVKGTTEIARILEHRPPDRGVYLHALRIHHWTKNLLVFLPLIAAHQLYDGWLFTRVLLAFLSFCLAASSIYLVNDLLDLADDREHPTKCNRMLASGRLPLVQAVALAPLLMLAAVALASPLSPPFQGILALYYALMLGYCLHLRGLIVVDAVAVAAGYALRVIAGAVAADLTVSPWEAAFCFLFFFGLTLLKRYAELVTLHSVQGPAGKARAYLVRHRKRIAVFGCWAGYSALLLLAVYIRLEQAAYPQHELLWLLWGLILYWFSHMWLMAGRGRIIGDPVAFALKDRVSLIVGGLALVTVLIVA